MIMDCINNKQKDNILCRDMADARRVINEIGDFHIVCMEFVPTGEVRLFLDCKVVGL